MCCACVVFGMLIFDMARFFFACVIVFVVFCCLCLFLFVFCVSLCSGWYVVLCDDIYDCVHDMHVWFVVFE